MINQTYFESKMLETFKLLGNDTKQNRDMAKAIYGRIQHNYTDEDLFSALESAMQSENPKINYPILLRHLNTKRALRFEDKARADREAGETGARKFWNIKTEENCRTRNCGHCQHIAGRCDTIARHTLDAVKVMVRRKWKKKGIGESFEGYYKDARAGQQQFNKNIIDGLHKQFPGAGFDRDYEAEKRRTLTRDELKVLANGGILPPIANTTTRPAQMKFEDGFTHEED